MSKIDLYEGIKADLTDLTYIKEDGSTGRVQTVALWRNQPGNYDKENPFLYDAIFIEFLTSNFMESSSKVYQTVDMTVRLHICFNSFKTEDLDVLRLTEAVYMKMQQKQYSYWGVMKRRNEEQNFDHGDIQDFMQDYDCGKGKDYGADQRPNTPATIDNIIITPEITNDL